MNSDFLMGGMMALAAFNFLIFLNTKDRGYLYYSLFLILFYPYFYFLGFADRLDDFFLPNYLSFFLDINVVCIAISFSAFTRVFLGLKSYPLGQRFMDFTNILLVLIVLLHYVWHNVGNYFVDSFNQYCYIFKNALNIVILAYLIGVFIFSIWVYFKGFSAAKFFVLANVSSFVGICAKILGKDTLEVFPDFTQGNLWMQTGLFVQSVLFSMALADKINLLRRQVLAEQAQKAELERKKLEEIAQITATKNEELAQKVTERTQQLTESNQELLALSEELRTSLDQKQVLLKEIHHRVKNNLQIISSLLNLQTQHISDEKTLAAIKEGQNRVISMALVHQKLYQNENLARVEVGDFLQPLLQHLHDSFQGDNKRISYELKSVETWLDVDTIIPIGLIANEWVSNAYKYAFVDRDSGHIEVIFQTTGKMGVLSVRDNGVGKLQDLESNKSSLGLKLVRMLSSQIQGTTEVEGSGTGLCFRLTFVL